MYIPSGLPPEAVEGVGPALGLEGLLVSAALTVSLISTLAICACCKCCVRKLPLEAAYGPAQGGQEGGPLEVRVSQHRKGGKGKAGTAKEGGGQGGGQQPLLPDRALPTPPPTSVSRQPLYDEPGRPGGSVVGAASRLTRDSSNSELYASLDTKPTREQVTVGLGGVRDHVYASIPSKAARGGALGEARPADDDASSVDPNYAKVPPKAESSVFGTVHRPERLYEYPQFPGKAGGEGGASGAGKPRVYDPSQAEENLYEGVGGVPSSLGSDTDPRYARIKEKDVVHPRQASGSSSDPLYAGDDDRDIDRLYARIRRTERDGAEADKGAAAGPSRDAVDGAIVRPNPLLPRYEDRLAREEASSSSSGDPSYKYITVRAVEGGGGTEELGGRLENGERRRGDEPASAHYYSTISEAAYEVLPQPRQLTPPPLPGPPPSRASREMTPQPSSSSDPRLEVETAGGASSPSAPIPKPPTSPIPPNPATLGRSPLSLHGRSPENRRSQPPEASLPSSPVRSASLAPDRLGAKPAESARARFFQAQAATSSEATHRVGGGGDAHSRFMQAQAQLKSSSETLSAEPNASPPRPLGSQSGTSPPGTQRSQGATRSWDTERGGGHASGSGFRRGGEGGGEMKPIEGTQRPAAPAFPAPSEAHSATHDPSQPSSQRQSRPLPSLHSHSIDDERQPQLPSLHSHSLDGNDSSSDQPFSTAPASLHRSSPEPGSLESLGPQGHDSGTLKLPSSSAAAQRQSSSESFSDAPPPRGDQFNPLVARTPMAKAPAAKTDSSSSSEAVFSTPLASKRPSQAAGAPTEAQPAQGQQPVSFMGNFVPRTPMAQAQPSHQEQQRQGAAQGSSAAGTLSGEGAKFSAGLRDTPTKLYFSDPIQDSEDRSSASKTPTSGRSEFASAEATGRTGEGTGTRAVGGGGSESPTGGAQERKDSGIHSASYASPEDPPTSQLSRDAGPADKTLPASHPSGASSAESGLKSPETSGASRFEGARDSVNTEGRTGGGQSGESGGRIGAAEAQRAAGGAEPLVHRSPTSPADPSSRSSGQQDPHSIDQLRSGTEASMPASGTGADDAAARTTAAASRGQGASGMDPYSIDQLRSGTGASRPQQGSGGGQDSSLRSGTGACESPLASSPASPSRGPADQLQQLSSGELPRTPPQVHKTPASAPWDSLSSTNASSAGSGAKASEESRPPFSAQEASRGQAAPSLDSVVSQQSSGVPQSGSAGGTGGRSIAEDRPIDPSSVLDRQQTQEPTHPSQADGRRETPGDAWVSGSVSGGGLQRTPPTAHRAQSPTRDTASSTDGPGLPSLSSAAQASVGIPPTDQSSVGVTASPAMSSSSTQVVGTSTEASTATQAELSSSTAHAARGAGDTSRFSDDSIGEGGSRGAHVTFASTDSLNRPEARVHQKTSASADSLDQDERSGGARQGLPSREALELVIPPPMGDQPMLSPAEEAELELYMRSGRSGASWASPSGGSASDRDMVKVVQRPGSRGRGGIRGGRGATSPTFSESSDGGVGRGRPPKDPSRSPSKTPSESGPGGSRTDPRVGVVRPQRLVSPTSSEDESRPRVRVSQGWEPGQFDGLYERADPRQGFTKFGRSSGRSDGAEMRGRRRFAGRPNASNLPFGSTDAGEMPAPRRLRKPSPGPPSSLEPALKIKPEAPSTSPTSRKKNKKGGSPKDKKKAAGKAETPKKEAGSSWSGSGGRVEKVQGIQTCCANPANCFCHTMRPDPAAVKAGNLVVMEETLRTASPDKRSAQTCAPRLFRHPRPPFFD